MRPGRKVLVGAAILLVLVAVLPPLAATKEGRIVAGTWTSLGLGLLASVVAVVLGAGIGFVAGFRGGRVERWLTLGYRDLLDSVPQFILLLVLVKGARALIGEPASLLNPLSVALSVGVANSTQVAALILNKVKLLRENRYVKAAQLVGMPTRDILLRKIAPHCVSEVVVPFTHLVGWSIFIETAMSYMRFGVDAPFTSLGSVLASMDPIAHPEHRAQMAGVCVLTIGLTVCLKVVGDGLHGLTHRRAEAEAAPPAP
jgi:peptide/nickel transport system permease protein